MQKHLHCALMVGLCMWLNSGALAQAPSARGQLLYETHCIACHSTQMHWRENRRATDWAGLVAQVRRWQGEAQLSWSASDIDAVARHLNDTVYHFATPRVVAMVGRAN